MKRDIIIKILSLALGLTIGIILIGKIFYELSYDTTYPDSDRIYKIVMDFDMEGKTSSFPQVSGAVAPGFKEEIPEVESSARTTLFFSTNFKDENDNEFEVENFISDPSFFDVFKTEILAGSPDILNDPTKIMISRSLAEKLGGIEESVGKILRDRERPGLDLIIGGIFEDFKPNGSIHPQLIGSIFLREKGSLENWEGNENYIGYVKLKPGVAVSSLGEAIKDMQRAHQHKKTCEILTYSLQKLPSIHREQRNIKNAILILSIVAFLLLSISLLNYVLVVISGLVRKSKEMGVRKCYGACAKDIYLMLFRQSVWQICIALLISGGLIFAGKGLIKDLTGYSFSELMVPESILAIAVTIVLILLFSVLIPAHSYLAVPVDKALRGFVKRNRIWKIALLGLQISINVFIVIFILVVWLQHNKLVNFNPGYNADNVLYVRYWSYNNLGNYIKILDELAKIPEVETAGVGSSLLFNTANGNNVSYDDLTNGDHVFNIADLGAATPEVFDILDLNFIEGGKPSHPGEAAVSKHFVEKMNEITDWSDGAVRRGYISSGMVNEPNLRVTGVYDDILVGNLMGSDKRPSMMYYGSLDHKEFYSVVYIKVNKITPEIISQIQETVRKAVDNDQLEVMSYPDEMKRAYDEFISIRTLLIIGAGFSLLIAFMGLIGFLSDETDRRTKEFAIRKINGASMSETLKTFSADIIKLSLASAIIAGIGVYVLANHWLTQFEEKIPLSPMIFILGSLLIITIVMIVVIFNGRKISLTNPVDSLRME